MQMSKFCPIIKGQCKGTHCMAWKKEVHFVFFKKVVFEGCSIL